MDELIEVCNKFKNGSYTIEDLYRRLSWIAVPNQCIDTVSRTARELEIVRFTELEGNWRIKGLEIIDKLLQEIGYK